MNYCLGGGDGIILSCLFFRFYLLANLWAGLGSISVGGKRVALFSTPWQCP